MNDKPIGKQISRITVTLTGGLVLLAIFAMSATLLLRNVFWDYRDVARGTVVANGVYKDIFQARVAALKWEKTGAQSYVDEFEANMTDLGEVQLDAAQDGLGLSNPQVSELQEDVLVYGTAFEGLQKLQAEFDQITADLRDRGTDVRKDLSSIMSDAFDRGDAETSLYAARVQEKLLLGRVYIEIFSQLGTDDAFERATSELRAANDVLSGLSGENRRLWVAARLEAVEAQLSEMRTRLDDLGGTVRNRKAARAELDGIGLKVISDFATAVNASVAKQGVLGQRGEQIALWTVVVIVLISAAIVVGGWFYGRGIARRIVTGLEGAVNAMTKIAEGDLEAPVPGSGAKNEIGRMAQALSVFKTNGKAAIAAAEREKAAEQERLESEAKRKKLQDEQEEQARQQAEEARQAMITQLSDSLGKVVAAASDGDFTARVEARFDDAALQGLAQSVNKLVDNVETGLTEADRVLSHLSAGDLRTRMEGDFKGTFAQLQQNLNATMDNLGELISKISAQSDSVLEQAARMSKGAQDLSHRAEDQATSLEETSSAIEEISASAQSGEQGANTAKSNADNTLAEVSAVSDAMRSAMSTMEDIQEASKRISEIVDIIDGIAVQTNLLSLNASVEAARAGASGKGFAVVASEVRNLAMRSAEASQDISSLIEKSTQEIDTGVRKVRATGEKLIEIHGHVGDMAEVLSALAEAGRQQSQSIQEVNNAISALDRTTQNNASLADEANSNARVLSEDAKATQDMLRSFKLGSDHEQTEAFREAG